MANLPISGYVTTTSWAARNPRTAAAVVRALERGQALADSDRAAVNTALTAYAGITPKESAAAAIGTFPVSQQVQAAPLQRLADLMLRYGLLKQQFDVTPMTK